MNRVPTNAGVSCPLAFVANVWLNILEPESDLRTIFCGLLIHVRHTIASVYLINLLFSFIFRTLLVLYSDRGLVSVILSYRATGLADTSLSYSDRTGALYIIMHHNKTNRSIH